MSKSIIIHVDIFNVEFINLLKIALYFLFSVFLVNRLTFNFLFARNYIALLFSSFHGEILFNIHII